MAERPSSELKNTNYELFIAALSVLSIVNLTIMMLVNLAGQDPVIIGITSIIDIPLSLIFLGDFVFRLMTAPSKRGYFLKEWGWADLVASLPFPQLKLLRLTRLLRAGRLMREHGGRRMLRDFLADRAGSALLVVLFLLLLVVEFGGMFVYLADRSSPDANIKTASDAVWWAYITVTTIGYGDRYPVTNAARLWALMVAAAGVGLFGVLTGYLANAFLAPKQEAAEAAGGGAAEPAPAPAEPAVSLSDIKQLLAEQQHMQSELLDRMAALEQLLAAAAPKAEG